ncbi:MAG: BMC domain-containing protein [Tissierellia bacterium]|nr:BMC domain-containing protein [Tissierellia bacterium]
MAYGFIETAGLTAAITASDILLKAANLTLIGLELTKGFGYTVVKIEGNVSAVKAGMDACSAAPELLGKIVSISIIPRPLDNIDMLVKNDENNWFSKKENTQNNKVSDTEEKEESKEHEKEIIVQKEKKDIPGKTKDELEKMKVVELRKLARELDTSIPRNKIKYAKKKELVEEIGAYYQSLD